MQVAWLGYARGIAGAIAGAVAGYFIFALMWQQGFYALAVPAALMGLACGFASRIVSNALGAACAVAGIATALLLEWRYAPFRVDDSLGYFLTHVQDLRGVTLLMIALSGVFGFWFGRGRSTFAPAGTSP